MLTVSKAIRAWETLASAGQSTTAQQHEVKAFLALPGAAIGGGLGYYAAGGYGAAAGAGIGSTLSLMFTALAMAKFLTNESRAEYIASPKFARLAMDLRLGGVASKEAVEVLAQFGRC